MAEASEEHQHPKTFVRRVSFSEKDSTVFVEGNDEADEQLPTCARCLDGLEKCLAHGEACYFYPTDPPTGAHGETVSATLAEDIEEQRHLEALIAKAEADQAELLERLHDLEIMLGVHRASRPAQRRKVSFSMDADVIEGDGQQVAEPLHGSA